MAIKTMLNAIGVKKMNKIFILLIISISLFAKSYSFQEAFPYLAMQEQIKKVSKNENQLELLKLWFLKQKMSKSEYESKIIDDQFSKYELLEKTTLKNIKNYLEKNKSITNKENIFYLDITTDVYLKENGYDFKKKIYYISSILPKQFSTFGPIPTCSENGTLREIDNFSHICKTGSFYNLPENDFLYNQKIRIENLFYGIDNAFSISIKNARTLERIGLRYSFKLLSKNVLTPMIKIKVTKIEVINLETMKIVGDIKILNKTENEKMKISNQSKTIKPNLKKLKGQWSVTLNYNNPNASFFEPKSMSYNASYDFDNMKASIPKFGCTMDIKIIEQKLNTYKIKETVTSGSCTSSNTLSIFKKTNKDTIEYSFKENGASVTGILKP